MTSLRRALLGLGLAGLIVGALAGAITLTSNHVSDRGLYAFGGVFIGWSFIGTGLFAWWRRPASRVGGLMCAVGFAWALAALTTANAPGLFIAGVLLGNVYAAIMAHLLLAFPQGRLEHRTDRLLVAAAYLTTTVLLLPGVLFFDGEKHGCEGCPDNPLMISDQEDLSMVLFGADQGLGALVIAGVIVRLFARRRAAAPPQRRALGPVLWAGVATVALLGLQLSSSVAGLPNPVVEGVAVVGLVAFAAVPYAFLAGIARSRMSRAGAVGDLVARLHDAPHAVDLRAALAEALGDPSLALAYWLPARGTYVDADGHPVVLGGAGRTVREIERDGRRVGAIVHDAALDDEPELVRAAGAAAALALENERLEAELRARIAEVSASRARIVEAGDAERRRLERDLHDGAQQRLVALSLSLHLARGRLATDPAQADEVLAGAQRELEQALAELRELARGIHPAVLVDRGLPAALESLAHRAAVPVDVELAAGERLPAPVEAAAYFVVSEALANVAKYADAASARVSVQRVNGNALVEVSDDGVGGADPARGSGLRGLADRVSALDGRLELHSPPGGGTRVRAEIPCG